MIERSAKHYGIGLAAASFSALIEICRTLRSYRDSIVLVGGWVPYLLIEKYGRGDFAHVGSIDIDLAVDPKGIDAEKYATIVELIRERDYKPRLDKNGDPILFSFSKELISTEDGRPYKIWVDFLTARGERGRAICLQGLRKDVRSLLNTILRLESKVCCTGVSILDIPGCPGMKGITLGERYKEKDAYDIYSAATQCLGGGAEVAGQVNGFLGEELMKRGIDYIKEKFRTQRSHLGSLVYGAK